MSNFFKTYLIPSFKLFFIPLAVGLATYVITSVLPLFSKESKLLTYKISDPIEYFGAKTIGSLEIRINGQNTNSLYSNQIYLENVGKLPLKEIPVRLVFTSSDSLFKVLNVSIETFPAIEFGKINNQTFNDTVKLDVDLINPTDKITLNILTNKKAKINLYSKSEGMILKQIETDEKKAIQFNIPIITLIASIFSMILGYILFRTSFASFQKMKYIYNTLFTAPQSENLFIVSALYGKGDTYFDITEDLNQLITENHLTVVINNSIHGDPLPGIQKILKLVYSNNGRISTMILNEGDTLVLPE